MKKLIAILASVALACTLAFTVTSCQSNEDKAVSLTKDAIKAAKNNDVKVLLVLDTCGIEHHACCLCRISIVILVVEINYLADALLDQCLGALVAREKCNVNRGTCEVSGLGI